MGHSSNCHGNIVQSSLHVSYFVLCASSKSANRLWISIVDTIAYLPFAAFFNATLALYTIPIGYFIANRVKKILKLSLPDKK